MQIWRPRICPFHRLIQLVPPASRVLDVGCGSGLFLGLLAVSDRISHGYGFDANPDAIKLAQKMRSSIEKGGLLWFEHIEVEQPWPNERFDVVSMIDVMHHIPLRNREDVIRTIASRLAPGGLFLYKDMVRRPLWRAWANRLHDFVITAEWIRYAPLESVVHWVRQAGMELLHYERIDMLWYGHELCVFRRSSC